MTIAEALAAGTQRLAPHSESPRLDAELLLAAVLDVSRGALFARHDDALSEDRVLRFDAQLQRRADSEPIAYLLGTQGFWTLDLQVNPDVLVPRPETELLVEWALEVLPRDASLRVADLGTGSGAIALAIAGERPQAQVLATDFSAGALRIAHENAQRNRVGNVSFAQGSWYAALPSPLAGEGTAQRRERGGTLTQLNPSPGPAGHPLPQGERGAAAFDLIVSNPPYIAAGDAHLPALKHEPITALTDNADGLSCLREIIAGAREHLLRGAWLLVEHGYDQGAAVRALFEQAGFIDIETRRDLGKQERATGGRRA